jgi:hypothetical protein
MPQRFRKAEKILLIRMAVKRHCVTWGNRANHHAMSGVCFLRQSQNSIVGTKQIENTVRSARDDMSIP